MFVHFFSEVPQGNPRCAIRTRVFCTFKEDDDKPSDLGYEATLAVVGIKQKQPILGG